jgi:hypothetical protein
VGDHPMEITVAQAWAAPTKATVELQVVFGGVAMRPVAGLPTTAHAAQRVDIGPAFRRLDIEPKVTLTHWQLPVAADKATLHALVAERDVPVHTPVVYALELCYTFTLKDAAKIVPRWPLLADLLYESPFGGPMWAVFDGEKKTCAFGDAFPADYGTKLEKGEYSLHAVIRHESVEVLKRLGHPLMFLERPLKSDVTLPIFSREMDALTGGSRARQRRLDRHDFAAFWVGLAGHLDSLPAGECFDVHVSMLRIIVTHAHVPVRHIALASCACTHTHTHLPVSAPALSLSLSLSLFRSLSLACMRTRS